MLNSGKITNRFIERTRIFNQVLGFYDPLQLYVAQCVHRLKHCQCQLLNKMISSLITPSQQSLDSLIWLVTQLFYKGFLFLLLLYIQQYEQPQFSLVTSNCHEITGLKQYWSIFDCLFCFRSLYDYHQLVHRIRWQTAHTGKALVIAALTVNTTSIC